MSDTTPPVKAKYLTNVYHEDEADCYGTLFLFTDDSDEVSVLFTYGCPDYQDEEPTVMSKVEGRELWHNLIQSKGFEENKDYKYEAA